MAISGGLPQKIRKLAAKYQRQGVFVVAFALIGIGALLATHAATPTVSIEAELGTLATGAKATLDTTASGGSSVKFTAASTTPLCSGYSNWSDPATWGGTVPAANSSPTIPVGTKVKLDVDVPHFTNVTVNGELCFPDRATLFSAKNIIVAGGKLTMGTAAQPLTQAVTIRLEGGSTDATVDYYQLTGQAATDIAAYNAAHQGACSPGDPAQCVNLGTKFGTQGMLALNGGVIDIHGQDRGRMWTELAANAAAGTNTLSLQDAVSWRAGDLVTIASGDFDPGHAEEVTVAAVSADGKTVTLAANLAYKHAGMSTCETDAGQTRCVDERSEVGLLTQNIKITGPTNTSTTGFGGQTAVLPGGSMKISNAEMYDMGQLGVLGRYPLHFHILGNSGSNSSVTNVSLHDNVNRAETIHGSNNIVTSGIVSANTIGHSVMLEDGFEVNNTFTNNLVMGTKYNPTKAQRLRLSDVVPAEFWITNPQNTLDGNSAAGGQGAGIWYDFEYESDNINATQAKFLPITAFNNNTAHSHTMPECQDNMGEAVNPVACTPGAGGTGITIDQYIGNPSATRAVLSNNNAWMNKWMGAWNDGILTYKDGMGANNGVNLSLQDTATLGGLYLGTTANTPAAQVGVITSQVRFYHGSGDVDGAWIGNFDHLSSSYNPEIEAFGDVSATTGDYTPRIRGIKFFSNKHANSTAFFSDSYRTLFSRPYLDAGIPTYPYINHDHWIADLDGSIKNGAVASGLLHNFSGLLAPAAGQPADQTLYTNTPGVYDSNYGSYGSLVQNGFDRSKILNIALDDITVPKKIIRDDLTTPSYGAIGAFMMGHAYLVQTVNGAAPANSFVFNWSGSEPGNLELTWSRATKPTSVKSGYTGNGISFPEVTCGSANKDNTWCYDSTAKMFHAYLQISGTVIPFGQAGNFTSLDYGAGGDVSNTYWSVN